MNHVFEWLGTLIEKKPTIVLISSLLLVGLLIFGTTQIRMATGDETLVKKDNDVFISNKTMEENFGAETIVVLLKTEDGSKVISPKNIEAIWKIEQQLKYNENIFSIMSPATVINAMVDRQKEVITQQVLDLSDGLQNISIQLKEISQELSSKQMLDSTELEAKINNLSKATDVFNELIIAQNNMSEGSRQLGFGLANMAEGIETVATQLNDLAKLADPNQELKLKLSAISTNLLQSSNGLIEMSQKTTFLQSGSDNTQTALRNISYQLTNETSQLKNNFTTGVNLESLKEMSVGFSTLAEKLSTISEGLRLFYHKSELMIADIPKSEQELETIIYDDGQLRPLFENVIINDSNSIMMIKLKGNLDDSAKDSIYNQILDAFSKVELETQTSYLISGKPVLDSALRSEMKSNMKIMVTLAVLIMFVILLIVFKVRWRVLSLGIIFISVIATLGLMGLLNVPMTMVSMAVFPILIGLGIDYSIQFHNRYEEEKSVKTTLSQIGIAVAIAVFATVLGFISLYVSPVPMIKDFGKMLTIGVVLSFVGSIFLLIPILQLRDQNRSKNVKKEDFTNNKTSFLDRSLISITKTVLKRPVVIIVLSVLFAVMGIWADSKVGVETDVETFMPQDLQALSDIHELRGVLGSTNQIALYLETEDILTEENISWIKTTSNEISKNYSDVIVEVKSIDSIINNMSTDIDLPYAEYINLVDSLPESQRKMFLTKDRTKSVILLNIKHMATEELQDFVLSLTESLKPSNMTVKITGKSILDVEMVKGLTTGRVTMTLVGMGLVFLALLLIYRNIAKAFMAIFPVIIIVGISGGIMYLLGLKYTPITATLGALILGMGTEMTIMLLERYIEEREMGRDKIEAMLVTVTKIGKATLASGLTTVGGFSVLLASKFVILKDFGLMTVINISLALLSTFIVLPAVLIVLDRFVISKDRLKNLQKGV